MADGERCQHFGDCGGCKSQDLPYEAQVRQKAEALGELLGGFWPWPVPVAPSPEIWYYRNKIELKFDREYFDEAPPKGTPRRTVLGFKRQGRWFATLDLRECRIFSPHLPAILAANNAWLAAHGQVHHEARGNRGCLRNLVLRQGKRTGDLIGILITATPVAPLAEWVTAMLAAAPFTSLYWGLNTSVSDVAIADELTLLHGPGGLREEVHLIAPEGERRLTLNLSPFGFFQSNTLATEMLYGQIRQWVRASAPPVLYDLYGGAATIAMACADLVPLVHSVESFAPASADGARALPLNGVSNVTLHTAPVEQWLRQAVDWPREATVILDPPRSGLHPKALAALLAWRPRELIYVSCKAAQFAQELASLCPAYRLTEVQAFDLFPHTPHVELLTRLHRQD